MELYFMRDKKKAPSWNSNLGINVRSYVTSVITTG